jgi:hypothetical protein
MIAAKTSILSDSEKAVIQTISMRLNLKEALEYLKNTGFDISERTYFRYKKKVESMKWERLKHYANLFTSQHLERIDRLELIERLMWKCFEEEKSPFKKTIILEKIANFQPFISNYYDSTTFVLQSRMKTDIIKEKEKGEFSVAEQSTIKRMTPFSGEDYNNGDNKGIIVP